MTVQVRPPVRRLAQSGFVPLRGLPANNIRPYRPSVWTPPTPDPLPPAPFFDLSWRGVGVFLLEQVWGLLNAPPLTLDDPKPLAYNVPGIYRFDITRNHYITGKRCSDNSSYTDSWESTDTVNFGTAGNKVLSISLSAPGTSVALTCVGDDGPVVYGITGSVSTDSNPGGAPFTLEPDRSPSRSAFEGSESIQITVTRATVNGNELELPRQFIPAPKPVITPLPRVEPGKERRPLAPPLIPLPTPAPNPAPAVPDPVPAEPGPAPAPTITPTLPPWIAPVIPADGQGVTPGGVTGKSRGPVAVTNPTDVFPIPGGAPIPANGPQANLQSIAQELGRIEQKLHQLMNPVGNVPDWMEQLRSLWELLNSVGNSKTYRLTEYCNPTGDPEYDPPYWDFTAAGAPSFPGIVINRLDALAEMLDQTVRVKQQVCEPVRFRPQGDLVTVNFIAAEKPPGSSAYLRKYMRYRDLNGLPEAKHVEHWLGFTWDAGPAIVHSKGAPWGIVEVWAADPEEGRRVIAHAAAIAGVDLKDKGHSWVDSTSRSTRYGRTGRMAVERNQSGVPCISKRDGSNGQPTWGLGP
jgi:hypothetical protein